MNFAQTIALALVSASIPAIVAILTLKYTNRHHAEQAKAERKAVARENAKRHEWELERIAREAALAREHETSAKLHELASDALRSCALLTLRMEEIRQLNWVGGVDVLCPDSFERLGDLRTAVLGIGLLRRSNELDIPLGVVDRCVRAALSVEAQDAFRVREPLIDEALGALANLVNEVIFASS